SVMLLGGLGTTDDVHMGGTQYAKVILNEIWGLPPALDMSYEKRVQQTVREAIAAGLVESAHDVSDGGLAVTLAESSFGGSGIGARIEPDSALRPEFLMFHEGPSRILISTAQPENILELAQRQQVEVTVLGATMEGRLRVSNRSTVWIDSELEALRQPWETSLERMMNQ
ncbi:MAG: hypothetical protein JO022_14230, partial [Acidobacteriaceae bacterium]|nr:hypothetical protein [Acidobacteriaceae bacterium]